MEKLLPSRRTFKVWEYQVSHGQLLVRSPKSPASISSPAITTNLDIVFNGVEYMALPRIIQGAEIVAPNGGEMETLTAIIGRPLDIQTVMIFRSGTHRFPVIAASMSVTENDWDIFDSPFEFRSQFRNSPPSSSTMLNQ